MKEMEELKHHDQVLITSALSLAESVHERQYRKPHKIDPVIKVPYINHPMRVAIMVMSDIESSDSDMIAAALLHDVVEDGNGTVTTADLENKFGRTVALMVSVLSKPPADKKIARAKQLATYHERLAQSATSTKIVKLCDRVDNLREASEIDSPDWQKQYLMETLEIYLPLAHSTNDYLHGQLLDACGRLSEVIGYEAG